MTGGMSGQDFRDWQLRSEFAEVLGSRTEELQKIPDAAPRQGRADHLRRPSAARPGGVPAHGHPAVRRAGERAFGARVRARRRADGDRGRAEERGQGRAVRGRPLHRRLRNGRRPRAAPAGRRDHRPGAGAPPGPDRRIHPGRNRSCARGRGRSTKAPNTAARPKR